jgi:hypothetical protein
MIERTRVLNGRKCKMINVPKIPTKEEAITYAKEVLNLEEDNFEIAPTGYTTWRIYEALEPKVVKVPKPKKEPKPKVEKPKKTPKIKIPKAKKGQKKEETKEAIIAEPEMTNPENLEPETTIPEISEPETTIPESAEQEMDFEDIVILDEEIA